MSPPFCLVELLVPVFPTSSGRTFSSVFVSHFGGPFWYGPGYSFEWVGIESRFNLPILSITSFKVSSMVGSSCGGESALENDSTDWFSIGTPLQDVESNYQILEKTSHVWIYPGNQVAAQQHCQSFKIQGIWHLLLLQTSYWLHHRDDILWRYWNTPGRYIFDF